MNETRREPSFAPAVGESPPVPRRRRRSVAPLLLGLALAVVAAVAAWWWLFPSDFGVVPPPAAPPQAAAPARPPEETVLPNAPLASDRPVAANDVPAALAELFGRDAVLRFLETADFPRRAVATLDNLGREHAPVAAWPVHPAPGRFTVQDQGGGVQVIAPANAARYQPFVDFAAGIDAKRAADLYRRMYPLLQQAHRQLGFGDRSLHQRVLQVVDLLLATPEPRGPLQVTLTEVKGPIEARQPWTRYQFADPQLQSLAAGQKMLLRMGPQQRAALKAKLRALRAALLA